MTSESEQKVYSLQQLEEWMQDAMESEATPEEVYATIIHAVEKSAIYHRACLNHSSRLLSLLEDNVNIKIDGYDDFELPLPKQDNVVKMSDYSVTEKDYWNGNVYGKDFQAALEKYGYEYTPPTDKERERFKLDSPFLSGTVDLDKLRNEINSSYNDGWTKQYYQDILDEATGDITIETGEDK